MQYSRLCLLALPFVFCAQATQTITLENNQPFAMRMPVGILEVPDQFTAPNSKKIPAQKDGTNLIFIADTPASRTTRVTLDLDHTKPAKQELNLTPIEGALTLKYRGLSLGHLTWGIVAKDAKRPKSDDIADQTKPDFDQLYHPLALKWTLVQQGPVFDQWRGQAEQDGLALQVTARVFNSGFLELDAELRNDSAKATNVYGAVVCRWDQTGRTSRSLCYDNHINPLGDNDSSSFRIAEGRHQFIQRGADWIRTTFAKGTTVAWLNDFAPSFTVEAAATAKTPAHYTGANLPQLGQEVQTRGDTLYSITEIARSNTRSFRDRLKENILPPKGQSVRFRSRMVFGGTEITDKRADEMFVGWTSYNERSTDEQGARIAFGTRAVRFGTSYFPYSTLGENFDQYKLPGMDRESFWPLAADTVNRWRLFQDDIRRDLRIAKSMGFQLIRLHHLELLAPIEKSVRDEYLDFLFGELRHLQLKALLDLYASPDQIRVMLKKYGEVVDSLEVENETLIWGIPKDRPTYWKEVYEAVKSTAPHVRVHFTGYNNTGMFDRLTELGVPFDRVCLHSYLDTMEAMPSARGYSLALSSYANKVQKPPVITEWNWRGLTKMTEHDRAKIYPQIIEGAVGTRGIPDFYQFQFNETLCPNPRSGRGNILRHYELLHLSRRLKQEAYVLQDIIRKYSDPSDSLRLLSASAKPISLNADGTGNATLVLENHGTERLHLQLATEASPSLSAVLKGEASAQLAPGNKQSLPITLRTSESKPGFFYAFVRVALGNDQFRYVTMEARKPGQPVFAGTAPKLDLHKPIQVVYAADASVLEVETAIAIAETLESASGVPIDALPADKADKPGPNQIWVGTTSFLKTLPASSVSSSGTNVFAGLIQLSQGQELFAITGNAPQEVEKAGMNFILSYWKSAKDSAARRVGLVAKELPRGIDAAKLP